jgi:hypothetical protein
VLAGSPGRGSVEGQGFELARLREEGRRLGAEVLEAGGLAAPGAALRAADVLVCCSAWEGLSLAWLEALACGTPVVSADAAGPRRSRACTRGSASCRPQPRPRTTRDAILATCAGRPAARAVALTSARYGRGLRAPLLAGGLRTRPGLGSCGS